MYEIGDVIILSINSALEVGMIVKRHPLKTVPTYDVFTERGARYFRITTDSENFLIFIDIRATEKYSKKITFTIPHEEVIKKVKSYEITGKSDIGQTDGIQFDGISPENWD